MPYSYYWKMKMGIKGTDIDRIDNCDLNIKQSSKELANYNYSLPEKYLYISYDCKRTKIYAYMFVNKQHEILSIDSFVNGKNHAKKLIDNYEKRFKCNLIPYDPRPDAINYWKKIGKLK